MPRAYLDSVELPEGRYSYHVDRLWGTPSMTAEAYFCRQLLGWRKDDPRLVEGSKLVLSHPPKYFSGDHSDVYEWYYATQMCHNMEGQTWDTWNRTMRVELPAHQVKEGRRRAVGTQSGTNGEEPPGAGFTPQACRCTCSEVYYRHLPIYSAYGERGG